MGQSLILEIDGVKTYEVYCDGCDAYLGLMDEVDKSLHLCGRCDWTCCASDSLRRAGKLVEAAAMERQWAIEHAHCTTVGYSDVEEADDIPF